MASDAARWSELAGPVEWPVFVRATRRERDVGPTRHVRGALGGSPTLFGRCFPAVLEFLMHVAVLVGLMITNEPLDAMSHSPP